MYKNKFGKLNNIAGRNVRRIRKEKFPDWSQKILADKLQLEGHDIDKNAIQRMESGERFINDIELKALSQVLQVTVEELLDESVYETEVTYKEENPSLTTSAVADKR